MNSDHEQLELIRRYIDGTATSEEINVLQETLRNDAVFRRLYARYANLDSALGDGRLALGAVVKAEPRPSQRSSFRWLSWRPLAAAAAGLVIGLFSASMVWAVAFARNAQEHSMHLENSGFESPAPWTPQSMPSPAGQWAADPCEVVENKGRVRPREGSHMLQFLAASNTGDYEGSKNMAADLWQVVELPGSGHRTVKVRAWFNAETSKQARFHIAAVAGDGNEASAPQLWEQRYSDSTTLAFARSMTFVDHDPATWEAGELTLQVPPQARVLVIGIAAYRLPVVPANEWFPAQFVDDVSVTISEEAQP